MRRTLPLLLAVAVTVAACGGDDGTSDVQAASAASGGTEPAVVATDGSGPASDDSASGAAPADLPTSTHPDKPTDIDLPAGTPTELHVEVLEQGTGPKAEDGDTVIVDYIGVRSRDGEEFDNSYDRDEPFPVTLGKGAVIEGWDEGLVGVQAGERLQLDIPSDLAYGSEARGDVIGEDEALTFVIDVRAVIPQTDLADQPGEPGVPASEDADGVTTVDLIEGEGDELRAGDTAVLHIVLFRGDNLVALDTTWPKEPIQIPMGAGAFPALAEGMPGMRVGGRRAITFPPEAGFGPDGNNQIGLPADTDAILVVDLLGKY